MASIQRLGRALIVASALLAPAFASADSSSTTSLCDGEKTKEKEPTAEKSEPKRETDKSSKSSDDKAAPKPDAKEANKS
jgi:hypothetical protein